MKRWLSLVVVLVIVPVFLAHAEGYELAGKAGEYNVTVMVDKNLPARGYNNLDIFITDETSKPVTAAKVEVEYLMPSLPGRPPMMDYTTAARRIGNKYRARIDLSMAGEWTIAVRITHEGKTEIKEFTFVVK